MNLTWSSRFILVTVGAVLAGALAGCTPQDEPRRYQVPQEKTAEAAPEMGAMPAMGHPTDRPSGLTCDTPQGWSPGKVGGMRKAAFVVQDGDRKVEITAIDLRVGGGMTAGAGDLLPNVNRWRGQIKLPEITQSELDKSKSPIKVADVEGHYVEMLGPEGTDPQQAILAVVALRGEQAWFFKLWGDAKLALREKTHFQEFVKSVRFEAAKSDDAASASARPKDHGALMVSTEAGGDKWPLEYDAPKDWTPSEADGPRKAPFHVAEGDRKVEVDVVRLPGSVETLLPNVNRWRRQVQLGDITQAELEKTLSPISVAGIEGHYVELIGPEGAKPRLAMLVVVATRDGKSCLVRMTGDADLALREKERFQGFVKSFKLSKADQGKNGD